ncbi:flavodoxin domain-containing protein [Rhodothermus profundi]|uniref:Flavodoxin n=1 Tax=Rhodothermus profundi TaxID=633813 RepID=A0A1M6RA41_9BACT|nr:flavodoxin domain-containing protein [Rhodothermus profundi]SHK29177.1 Flavodoxin [Rhodothermus profundi]
MMDTVPYIPENAPFTPSQRAWLNGFLAGLFSSRPVQQATATSATSSSRPAVTILFGSQTGTAEGLAQEAGRRLNQQGFSATVVGMDAYDPARLAEERFLLVITSTYGDGDMPDNAQTFWDFLSSDQAPSLSHVQFSVLALGDSSYPNFCAAGKAFDARLDALGAHRLHPRIDCDVDVEAPFEQWFEGILKALKTATAAESSLQQTA